MTCTVSSGWGGVARPPAAAPARQSATLFLWQGVHNPLCLACAPLRSLSVADFSCAQAQGTPAGWGRVCPSASRSSMWTNCWPSARAHVSAFPEHQCRSRGQRSVAAQPAHPPRLASPPCRSHATRARGAIQAVQIAGPRPKGGGALKAACWRAGRWRRRHRHPLPAHLTPTPHTPPPQGFITAEEFLSIPELSINPLAKRLAYLFESINFREFLGLLAPFSPAASRDDKLRFMFNVYDVDGGWMQGLRGAVGGLVCARLVPGLEGQAGPPAGMQAGGRAGSLLEHATALPAYLPSHPIPPCFAPPLPPFSQATALCRVMTWRLCCASWRAARWGTRS